MSDKTPFTFLIRPDERAALKRLAKAAERSEGATLRWLIREAAKASSNGATTQRDAAQQPEVIRDATAR